MQSGGNGFLKSAKGPAADPQYSLDTKFARRRSSVLRVFKKSAKGPAADPQYSIDTKFARRRSSVLRVFMIRGNYFSERVCAM